MNTIQLGKKFKLYTAVSLCLTLIISLFMMYPASAATLMSSNFNNGQFTGWTPTSGNWSVVQDNGNYVYYQSGTSEGRTSAGNQSWTDYSVEADVKVENFNGSNRTYITGRYEDGNNFYAASLYNSSGGTLELRKKVGGSTTTLASKSNYGLAAGTWYTVKLEMSGSTIKMYVNGNLELTAADSSLTSGAVGLIAYKTVAKFDNVVVSDSEPSPSPTLSPDPTPTPSPEPTPTPDPSPTSSPEPTLTPTPIPGALSEYRLTGFAEGNTGGGSIAETDSRYKKVYNATDLALAVKKGSGIKVIEIMNDLDLGWNEIPESAKITSIVAHNSPLTHPVLKTTGVSKIYIDSFNGLTIFSANGSKIKHAAFVIKYSSNLIIRNLEFDELWEWDEATKGNYDKNDWDFITIEGASNKVWIDHCTFNKAYDGVLDVKKGSNGVTVSWSAFRADDQSSNSWVTQQVNAMESNLSAYPMYAYLRSSAVGLSKSDIIAIAAGQKKGHLVGSTEFASDNPNLEVTLHHNYYQDIQDRMPRLRGGNVHAYNIVMDSAGGWAAKKKITSEMENAMSSKGYKFGVTSNGAISTEDGAVLVEKSQIIGVQYPMRNNQADPADASYTGKIKALDTIYSLNGSTFRGNSDTANSPLAPVPAPVKAFSWNGFSSLPYNYTADDPSTLKARLTASNGSGAGKLSMSKENWLLTNY
ncbi:family 16 glycoside hydrolase [Paenibacillus harenae]|uniref:pectate lyase family protein n=1 Tax=Paenibacillus harenae TaxID=306543 RepID=UPI00040B7E7A|nr:family 16 glycoside hydrolase [Paenibacillus harenae]